MMNVEKVEEWKKGWRDDGGFYMNKRRDEGEKAVVGRWRDERSCQSAWRGQRSGGGGGSLQA